MKNGSNHNNTEMSGVKIFVNLPIETSIIIFRYNCPMFPYAQTCICLVYILNIAFVFFPQIETRIRVHLVCLGRDPGKQK